jgi:hypothetical protein
LKRGHTYDEAVSYRSRVYILTTLNIRCTFCIENSQTKEQYHGNTITYNTVLQNGCLRISEGNKFSMAIGSGTYTTGFYDSAEQVYGKKTSLQILLQVNYPCQTFRVDLKLGLKLY